MRTGAPRKSIQVFEKNLIVSRRSVIDSDTYWHFSNAYHVLGLLDSTVIQINRAISHQKKPEYFLDRGNYYAELGDLDKAAEDYTKTIEFDSTNTAAYNNRTFYIWFPQKQYQKAVDDMSKIIAIDPINAFAYNNRGYAYFKLNDIEHAFMDGIKSVELDKTNPYAYKNLALMYAHINDTEEASNAAKGAIHYKYPIENDLEFKDLLNKLGL